MALAVPSRLWLGGVISPHRDRALITELVQKVRACARSLAILVCVDGLAGYVTAFLRVFRYPVRTGRRGRPRLVVESGRLIGQVIKRYARRRVVTVVRRVVRGGPPRPLPGYLTVADFVSFLVFNVLYMPFRALTPSSSPSRLCSGEPGAAQPHTTARCLAGHSPKQ